MGKQCDGSNCGNCNNWNRDYIAPNKDFHFCTNLERFTIKTFYCSDHEGDEELQEKDEMDNITINVNGVKLIISSIEGNIIIKPDTDIPNLKEYNFSIRKGSTIKSFVANINSISKNISDHYYK